MEVDGKRFEVKDNDVVRIPALKSQRIKNLSDTEDLYFFCVCTPRFVPESYVAIEEKDGGL
jgi:mannose-6-phosphate isomerase-like protein (cupin superfamily)